MYESSHARTERWQGTVLLAAALFLPPSAALAGPVVDRPNIVFILADDLGWSDLGCYGADLHETPRLDRLARSGVRFTQAYAMSVCTPTRAALLTGRHAARLHMTVWREKSASREAEAARSTDRFLAPVTVSDLPEAETTLAEVLKRAGYLTLHVGKWHLGDGGHSPETNGFDINIGGTHWGAPATYFWPFRGSGPGDFRYVPGLGLGRPGDHLSDRLTDEALKLIEAAGERPFFLNLWYHDVHTPIEGKPELVEHYRGKLDPRLHHRNPEYAAMIDTLDRNVGRVLDFLESHDLARRTLVIFTSDNGGYINPYKGRPVTDNWPLRSGKGSLYEGGIRVPLVIRLPGGATGTCECPVICMDLFRTIAEAAGVDGGSGVDGMSLLPLARDPASRLARDALFFHFPHPYFTTAPVSAVRQDRWKLLEYLEDGRLELFDLATDPAEGRDLAVERSAETQRLRRRLHDWREEVGAQVPLPNLRYRASASGPAGRS